MLVKVCAGVGAFDYNQMYVLQNTVVYLGLHDHPTHTAKHEETQYRIHPTK